LPDQREDVGKVLPTYALALVFDTLLTWRRPAVVIDLPGQAQLLAKR
jgi:hypothetical protein